MSDRLIRAFWGFILALPLIGQTPPPAAAPKPAAPERAPGVYATMQTSLGTIVFQLFEKETPITVKNFIDLALGRKAYIDPRTGQSSRKPLYNGLIFHRVIPGFMIQTGDPLANGQGGTAVIKDEFDPSLKFDQPGRVGMANAGPGTGSCQFFITEAPTPHLNGKHTVFGQVIEGQDVVHKIATVPTNGEKPKVAVRIIRLDVKRVGPAPAAPKPAAARPAVKKAAPAKK